MNIHDKYQIQYGRLLIMKTDSLKIGFLQALIKPIFVKNLNILGIQNWFFHFDFGYRFFSGMGQNFPNFVNVLILYTVMYNF